MMSEVGDNSFRFDTTGDESRVHTEEVRDPRASKEVLSKRKEQIGRNGLLLPPNVQFDEHENSSGGVAKEEKTPANGKSEEIGEEEERLGHFVTLDRGPGQTRYWEAEEEQERRAQETCITCGEKGHDKRSCPHELCLACGALDSHTTRECAQGLTCFRCGERGHKLSECSQRRKPGGRRWVQDCARCGSQNHLETNCPTHWRLYYYSEPEVVDAFRSKLWLRMVRTKPSRETQVATFDYRSEEEDYSETKPNKTRTTDQPPPDWDPAERWCYNCAARGTHWGDDCPERRCTLSKPTGESSAYSEHLSRAGPYARAYAQPPPIKSGRPVPSTSNGGDLSLRIGNFTAGKNASMHIVDIADSHEPKSRQFARQSEKERAMARKKSRVPETKMDKLHDRGSTTNKRSRDERVAKQGSSEKKGKRIEQQAEKEERRKKEYGKRAKH